MVQHASAVQRRTKYAERCTCRPAEGIGGTAKPIAEYAAWRCEAASSLPQLSRLRSPCNVDLRREAIRVGTCSTSVRAESQFGVPRR
jgi:hypothetical protein